MGVIFMTDLKPFVGQTVTVKIYRHKNFKTYVGRLTDLSRYRICLNIAGRDKWISKPNYYKDSIEMLEDKEIKT